MRCQSETCKLGVKLTGWGEQIQNIKITNQLKFHKSDLVIYSHTPLRIQTIKKKDNFTNKFNFILNSWNWKKKVWLIDIVKSKI